MWDPPSYLLLFVNLLILCHWFWTKTSHSAAPDILKGPFLLFLLLLMNQFGLLRMVEPVLGHRRLHTPFCSTWEVSTKRRPGTWLWGSTANLLTCITELTNSSRLANDDIWRYNVWHVQEEQALSEGPCALQHHGQRRWWRQERMCGTSGTPVTTAQLGIT